MVLEFRRILLVTTDTRLLVKYSFSGKLLRGNCNFFCFLESFFFFLKLQFFFFNKKTTILIYIYIYIYFELLFYPIFYFFKSKIV